MFQPKNEDLFQNHIFHMYCSRMSIFQFLTQKIIVLGQAFLLTLNQFDCPKNITSNCHFQDKNEIQKFKILYALRKGRNIVRSFVKTPLFLHPPQGGGGDGNVILTVFLRGRIILGVCVHVLSHMKIFQPIDDKYMDDYLHHFLYIHNLRPCDGMDNDHVIDAVLDIFRWDRW